MFFFFLGLLGEEVRQEQRQVGHPGDPVERLRGEDERRLREGHRPLRPRLQHGEDGPLDHGHRHDLRPRAGPPHRRLHQLGPQDFQDLSRRRPHLQLSEGNQQRMSACLYWLNFYDRIVLNLNIYVCIVNCYITSFVEIP